MIFRAVVAALSRKVSAFVAEVRKLTAEAKAEVRKIENELVGKIASL